MSRVDGYGKPFTEQWEVERPPLGLVPREIWNDHRLSAIVTAVARYAAARRPIPLEWIEEYNDLVASVTNRG